MAKAKPYMSEAWMRLQYVVNRKTIQEIADESKVSYNTIRNKLIEFKLLRK